METRNRWRRAIIISMLVNSILLCGGGILLAGIFNTEPVEQLIELDLVSDDPAQQRVDTNQGQANPSAMVPQMVVPHDVTTSNPVAVQTIIPLSVDAVNADHTTDHATGEIQTSNSAIGGSTAGSSSVKAGGAESSNGSGGIVRPQILSQVNPTYPEATRQAGITGTVLLKVQILENGHAGDVSVKQSSGNDLLDQSAVTAVDQWRFTPAKERNTGRPVVCYTTIPVVFRLN